jgi:hypothetical protein
MKLSALALSIRVAAPAHRTSQTVFREQLSVLLGYMLRAAV